MRIAFVGLPLAALLLQHDGHEIVWAGICRKGAIGTRRLTRILGRDRVAVVPDLAKAIGVVAERKPRLVVSWFWTKKVPPRFRAIAPLGAVGVHPSLLPRWRGPDPYFWAIDAGDRETGVTAHVLEDDYDTGAVLGSESLAIDPGWTAWRLAKKLDRPSLRLLRRTVRELEGASKIEGRAQDESKATPAPAPTDDDLELQWSWEAERIERRVRAASPWPGMGSVVGDVAVTVTQVRATTVFPRVLKVGEAFVRKDGVAVVRTSDAAVELLEGRDEDDADLDARGFASLVAAERDRAI